MLSPQSPAGPAVTVTEITDVTAAGANIEVLDLNAMQLESSPLRALRVIVRLEAAAVVLTTTNLPVRVRVRTLKDLLAYVAYGPHTDATANGLPLRPDVMMIAPPDTEALIVTNAGYEAMSLLIPAEAIRAHLEARERLADFRTPSGVETLRIDADKLRTLFAWGKRLADIAVRQPELFNDSPAQRAAAHVELVETLLAALATSSDFETDRGDRARQAYSSIIKRVEDYVLAHAGDRIFVSDLCRAAAVSERTLESAFREVMDLTPMNYLVRMRLHRVREALLAGSNATTTVSAEALNWGFWHFGEFSRAYRQCFGELPSDTLRRRP
jgi:AraC-like DNA-binding protein